MKIYENVKVVDFHSLYPSIIRQLNLSVEFDYPTILTNDQETNLVIPKEYLVSSDVELGILPKYIAELMELREKYKSENKEAEQLAVKIIQNSVYGILSQRTAKFVLGDTSIAATITWFGRNVLKNLIKRLPEYNLKCIYAKTDSAFIIDINNEKTGEEICNIAQKLTDEIVKDLCGFDNKYILFDLEDELLMDIIVNKNNYVKVYPDEHCKLKGASFFNKTYSQFQIDLTEYLLNYIIETKNVFLDDIKKVAFDFLNEKIKEENLDYFAIKHKLRELHINTYDNLEFLKKNNLSLDFGFYYNAVVVNRTHFTDNVIVYPINYDIDGDYHVNRRWLESQVDKILNKLELEDKYKRTNLDKWF